MSTSVPGVATAQEVENSNWSDGALVVNPSGLGLLKQTGALKKGSYHIGITGWASVDARVRLSMRNSGDSADVHSVEIPFPANNAISTVFPVMVAVGLNETIKVIIIDSIVGTIQVSIFYSRVA